MKHISRKETQAGSEGALLHVFKEQSAELCWLAYLITGNRHRSARAFSHGLDCDETNPTFQSFMNSWARKLVVIAAVNSVHSQMRASRLRVEASRHSLDKNWDRDKPSALLTLDLPDLRKLDLEQVLLGIDTFPRCALLLTVFEGLSILEVCSLLNADEQLVKTGRAQGEIELTRQIAWQYPRQANARSARSESVVPSAVVSRIRQSNHRVDEEVVMRSPKPRA